MGDRTARASHGATESRAKRRRARGGAVPREQRLRLLQAARLEAEHLQRVAELAVTELAAAAPLEACEGGAHVGGHPGLTPLEAQRGEL